MGTREGALMSVPEVSLRPFWRRANTPPKDSSLSDTLQAKRSAFRRRMPPRDPALRRSTTARTPRIGVWLPSPHRLYRAYIPLVGVAVRPYAASTCKDTSPRGFKGQRRPPVECYHAVTCGQYGARNSSQELPPLKALLQKTVCFAQLYYKTEPIN